MQDNPQTDRLPGSRRSARPLAALAALAIASAMAGCSSDGPAPGGDNGSTSASSSPSTAGDSDDSAELFPDVVEVELTELGGGRYTVSATLSSPYDSPDRYADAWRVLDPDGRELGVRELAHDHAGEQPFTRSTTIEIPDAVNTVTVQGRDQRSGYGGATVTVEVPRPSD